jgi:hypothetical protein
VGDIKGLNNGLFALKADERQKPISNILPGERSERRFARLPALAEDIYRMF